MTSESFVNEQGVFKAYAGCFFLDKDCLLPSINAKVSLFQRDYHAKPSPRLSSEAGTSCIYSPHSPLKFYGHIAQNGPILRRLDGL